MAIRAELLLATGNASKALEFSALAAIHGAGFAIRPIKDFHSLPAFPEDFATFAENAAGKALHYSRLQSGLILADDSGLVVPALGGAPGVRSARYAGPTAGSAEKMAKLLREMKHLRDGQRRALFVCVLAVAREARLLAVVSGCVEGRILLAPRGSSGFGYDPVFEYPSRGLTFAEMPADEKNRLSHRGRAFRELLGHLSAGA